MVRVTFGLFSEGMESTEAILMLMMLLLVLMLLKKLLTKLLMYSRALLLTLALLGDGVVRWVERERKVRWCQRRVPEATPS